MKTRKLKRARDHFYRLMRSGGFIRMVQRMFQRSARMVIRSINLILAGPAMTKYNYPYSGIMEQTFLYTKPGNLTSEVINYPYWLSWVRMMRYLFQYIQMHLKKISKIST